MGTENSNLPLKKYNLDDDALGSGTYGVVWKAINKRTKKVFALKQCKVRGSEKLKNMFLAEAEIMKSLRGIPNIVLCEEVFEYEGDIMIVQEMCEHGDLFDFIKKHPVYKKRVPQTVALKILFQLASGLSAAHKRNIIHRDLKSPNILVHGDGQLKICDFGHAKRIDPVTKKMSVRFIGTPGYLAPEILDNKPYGSMVDIWCLGLVMYDVCRKKDAFRQGEHEGDREFLTRVCEHPHEPIPADLQYSPDLLELIDWML